MAKAKANGVPKVSRPIAPGYGIPQAIAGTLPWSHAVERLEKARNYWVATARSDGRPHTVPVWGVWVDNRLYFGGGADAQWVRNLRANPAAAVHLESGDDVVIVEGSAEWITDPKHTLAAVFDEAYQAKYQMRHGVPFWVLRPRVAYAWNQFPKNTTRWTFDEKI